jgi:hypothetical protein
MFSVAEKGLNQSIAAAKAGVRGCTMPDSSARGRRCSATHWWKAGVDVSLMETSPVTCGHTIIEVDHNGQNCILLYGGSNKALTTAYIDSAVSHFGPDDVLLLQNEVNLVGYAMEAAHKRGMRIAFNAAPMDEEVKGYPLDLVDWLFVNEVEGAALSGKQSFPDILAELRRKYPRTTIVLTLGEAGAALPGWGRGDPDGDVPGRAGGGHHGGGGYVHRVLPGRCRQERAGEGLPLLRYGGKQRLYRTPGSFSFHPVCQGSGAGALQWVVGKDSIKLHLYQ